MPAPFLDRHDTHLGTVLGAFPVSVTCLPFQPSWVCLQQFFYDFTNMRLRVDSQYVSGPQIGPMNFTSFWLGDELYMITYDGNGSCQHINMGFGMMRNDWMIYGDQQNTTYLGKKSDQKDDGLHNCLWTRTCATAPACGGTDPNGFFNYFSQIGDPITDAVGVPFRLESPSSL